MYFRFISKEVGYGVYAKKHLKKGTFVGEYTGIVKTSDKVNMSYSWKYVSNLQKFPNVNYQISFQLTDLTKATC